MNLVDVRDEVSRVAAFEVVAGRLRPGEVTRSGWNTDTVMGRFLAGAVAWGAEQHADDEWQPARLTVDMFRPVPMAPLDVETTEVRDGRRLRVVDVAIHSAGKLMCRGSVVFARRSEELSVQVWAPAIWDVPDPEGIERTLDHGGYRMPWDQRTVAGPSSSGPQEVWLRETHGFLAGVPISPFVRVALAADHSNGHINAGDLGLGHINADLTLTLARLPVGEWIGLATTSRAAAEGVSVGTVDVYDRQGRIGQVSMVGLADGRVLRDP